jgi:uncharacterized membrane protein YdjX (TVP38/TMEM64 family)
LPEGDAVPVALLAALLPGLPYAVRNYLIALAGIPLRVYFWICLPVYLVRSTVALLLGQFSEDINWRKVLFLVVFYLVKLSICAWILHRLRRHLTLDRVVGPA